MTRSRGDLRMRDPEIFLPLSLLACAHCHARILRTMAVDYENLFVEESRLSPRAAKDFSSGCTIEAHNFQRGIDHYTQKNAVIVGISVDNVDSHQSFCTKEGLNFKLLADSNHVVVEKYGSIMEYNGMTLAARHTFLIDPAGVIRKVYLKVSPQGHREEVLSDLEQLQAAK